MKRRHGGKRIVIGVTGSFGSGKSTVASMFARLGATVIDADVIAHQTLALHSKVYKKVVARFGRGILSGKGRIDRRKLASVVFNDPRLLARLNAIVHEDVIRIIKARLGTFDRGVVVLDAPLLIEAGLTGIVDKVIVVRSKRKIQVARVLARTHLAEKDVHKRIRAQMPISLKVRYGDFIIDNSGTRNHTKAQVAMLWKKIIGESNNGGS